MQVATTARVKLLQICSEREGTPCQAPYPPNEEIPLTLPSPKEEIPPTLPNQTPPENTRTPILKTKHPNLNTKHPNPLCSNRIGPRSVLKIKTQPLSKPLPKPKTPQVNHLIQPLLALCKKLMRSQGTPLLPPLNRLALNFPSHPSPSLLKIPLIHSSLQLMTFHPHSKPQRAKKN